jgi:hypothetical protein
MAGPLRGDARRRALEQEALGSVIVVTASDPHFDRDPLGLGPREHENTVADGSKRYGAVGAAQVNEICAFAQLAQCGAERRQGIAPDTFSLCHRERSVIDDAEIEIAVRTLASADA